MTPHFFEGSGGHRTRLVWPLYRPRIFDYARSACIEGKDIALKTTASVRKRYITQDCQLATFRPPALSATACLDNTPEVQRSRVMTPSGAPGPRYVDSASRSLTG